MFTERLPEIVIPYGRRTERLGHQLEAIALALGGKAGERLSTHLNQPVSRERLLTLVRRIPPPPVTDVKVVGVDDWAYRKGRTYGTVLVDLENHRPLALLPDREAETLSQWLKDHPEVEIMSRDRSKIYRQGGSRGAPQAIQVADRFHLLQNLAQALEKVLGNHSQDLKAVEQAVFQAPQVGPDGSVAVSVPPPLPSTKVMRLAKAAPGASPCYLRAGLGLTRARGVTSLDCPATRH